MCKPVEWFVNGLFCTSQAGSTVLLKLFGRDNFLIFNIQLRINLIVRHSARPKCGSGP